jgi:predicted nucleic-acid-binding Zn-ribbon protein
MHRLIYLIFTILSLVITLLSAQNTEKPYWVENKSVENSDEYFYGIGISERSSDDADDKARISFSKNVSVKVKSLTEVTLSENEKNISDEYRRQTAVVSEMDLKGISITEQWYDINNKKYYSLICYTKRGYNAIFLANLNNELEILRAENQSSEKELRENQRHQSELQKIKLEKEQQDMALQKEKEKLKSEKTKVKQSRKSKLLKTRADFIKMSAPNRVIDIQTAEINTKRHSFYIAPTVNPFGVLRASYIFSWKLISCSVDLNFEENNLQFEDMYLKLRLLSTDGGVFHSAIAVGVNQFAHSVSNFDKKNCGYSIFGAANISAPGIYSHFSIYADIRKVSIGFIYYPLFNYFKGRVSLVLQNEMIFNVDYRNRFGDKLLIEPGIRFYIIPNKFNMLISYEGNEYTAFTFELFL